jgi:hypothetical protein
MITHKTLQKASRVIIWAEIGEGIQSAHEVTMRMAETSEDVSNLMGAARYVVVCFVGINDGQPAGLVSEEVGYRCL